MRYMAGVENSLPEQTPLWAQYHHKLYPVLVLNEWEHANNGLGTPGLDMQLYTI
jgi:hypothetical protein